MGMVAVPDGIPLKPSKLTPEKWQIMRQHPVVGEGICAPMKSFRVVRLCNTRFLWSWVKGGQRQACKLYIGYLHIFQYLTSQ